MKYSKEQLEIVLRKVQNAATYGFSDDINGEDWTILNELVKGPTKPRAEYLIGQRVIYRDEIGIVQRGPTSLGEHLEKPQKGSVWVHLPSKGFAMCIAEHNVQPLPNGQL